jgi:hypothetical protein
MMEDEVIPSLGGCPHPTFEEYFFRGGCPLPDTLKHQAFQETGHIYISSASFSFNMHS